MPPRVPHHTDINDNHDNRDRETMTPPTVANALLLRLPPPLLPFYSYCYFRGSTHALKSTS